MRGQPLRGGNLLMEELGAWLCAGGPGTAEAGIVPVCGAEAAEGGPGCAGGPRAHCGEQGKEGPCLWASFGDHPTQPSLPPPCVLASPLRVDGPGVLRWGLGGAEGDQGRHNRLLLCSLSCFAWPQSGRELNACLPRTKPSEFVSRFARIRLCFLVPNPPLAVQLCCKFPPRSRGTRLEAAEQVAPCRPPSNPAGP